MMADVEGGVESQMRCECSGRRRNGWTAAALYLWSFISLDNPTYPDQDLGRYVWGDII
jgi:hypothetical protein